MHRILLVAFVNVGLCMYAYGLPVSTLDVKGFFRDTTSQVAIRPYDSLPDTLWALCKISFEQNRYPYYLEIGQWDEVHLYQAGKEIGKTGIMLPMSEKSYFSHRNLTPLDQPGNYWIKINTTSLIGRTEGTDSIKLWDHSALKQQEDRRLIGQGIFFGLILIMSLFNLMIFFSVKDTSYLYYVLSIVGIGLYLFFFYGFTIEYLWPDSPRWNMHFFALIIPLTNVTRILFTKSYLHTKQTVPGWHKFLNVLTLLYLLPVGLWAMSYTGQVNGLTYTNDIIGLLGITVMTSITLICIIVYRQGYKPALWFLLAYVLFNLGGILFIIRELGYLSDNFFTRYLLQYGVAAQVILFSLGLASRLNQTRKKLADEILQSEKLKRNQEIEKKQIIENQKKNLEIKVKERTRELEELVNQVMQSEKELKELNDLKDKLFAIISHDLKSPLTTVDSFLNLLIHHHEKLSKEELAEVSNKTKYALQNLTLLLDNLLQWSRVQQEYVSFNPTSIRYQELISKNERLFSLLLEEKDLQIKINLASPMGKVWADKDMLDFVIRNLLHNAIKFSVRGSAIIIQTKQDAEQMVFVISDEGKGMSEKEIEKILIDGESFTKTGTEKEKGSGIGLLMCKDFVERNGGSFHLQRKTQGLQVSFSCPLVGATVNQ